MKEIEPVVAAETAATTEIYEDAVISGELASQEENPASIEADETEFENDEDVTGSEETDVAADEASDDTNTEANPEPGVRLNGSRGDDVLSGGNGNSSTVCSGTHLGACAWSSACFSRQLYP